MGTVVAGVGFGASFQGIIRTVFPLAPATRALARAALDAAIDPPPAAAVTRTVAVTRSPSRLVPELGT